MTDLKPCPHCGGKAELWRTVRPGARIACTDGCSVLITKEHVTDAQAIAAWNTRAIDPAAIRAQALREAAECITHTVAIGRRHPDEFRGAILALIDQPAAIRSQALREAAALCRDLARPIMGGVMQDRLGTQTRKVGAKAKARALVNAARLIEALIDQPAPGVKIKPLEWVKGAARSEIATYVVAEADNDDAPFWFIYIDGKSAGKLGEHPTEDAAKAAAEADYERRVRSAIREK